MQPAKVQTFVYVWGMGENMSLGNNKKQSEPVPYLIKQLKNSVCTQISTGNYFTVVATDKGELFGWGMGKHSRFGINEELVAIPKKVPLKVMVKEVSAGNWHTLIIDTAGDVYGSGHNKYGSLGLGHFNEVTEFTKSKISNCAKVACGDGFSLFLDSEGSIYGCGHQSCNGLASKDNSHTPTKLPVNAKFKHIAAGFTHSACVTVDGQVYTWGDGTFYQLGHNSTKQEKIPRKVEGLNGVNIIQTSCTRGQKNAHTMAVSAEGVVYTWGAGYKGKLGHEKSWSHSNKADEPIPRPIQVLRDIRWEKTVAGGIHSSLVTIEGRVFSFGCGSDGRLGHKESEEYTYLYREGYPKQIETLKGMKVIQMSSSYYHNACIAIKQV